MFTSNPEKGNVTEVSTANIVNSEIAGRIPLCSPQTPLTDMLFGDNVCDKIDNLTKGQKVAALVTNVEDSTSFVARGRGGGMRRRRTGGRGYHHRRGRFLGKSGQGRGPKRQSRGHSRKDNGKGQKKDM